MGPDMGGMVYTVSDLMGDTIPMGDADPAGVSDSTRPRLCTACGESFSGPVHTPCQGSDKTVRHPTNVVAPPTTAKRTIDALPPEAVPHAQDPSRTLNQYILVTQIGKGGMGTVWKAWDRKLTRWVAIKFLLAEETEGVERFEREAKLAARLRHPHIAAIHEVGEAATASLGRTTTHYLVMEFVEGQTLAAVKLSQREFLELFVKVARAIDVAHKGGVVHRDLKPLNIMVTADQWPYVMDFGLAKASETDSSLSNSGALMGTPAYMPPEQAEGRHAEVDARSDVYSLGATMYSVLLGRPPYPGQNTLEILRRLANDPLTLPRSLQPDFPPEVEAILVKALAKDKKDRYASAAELAADLARYLEGRPATQPPAPVPAAPRPSRGGMKGLAAAAAAAILIAGGAYVAYRPKDEVPPPPADLPLVRRPVLFPAAPTTTETFSLSIAVHPFAEVARITCDGEAVALEQRSSPLLESGLRIGAYEIVLRHPTLGEKTVRMSKESLKSGRTYVLWGRMENPSLRVDESP
jgi:predicted Ser/Thr protein kinase